MGYPSFAVDQHDALFKSTDKRKHLNYLLHDYSEENKKTYGDRMPTAGSMIRPLRTQVEQPARSSYKALEGEAAESRQLAAQVAGKRTITGQFCGPVNPALQEKTTPHATYEGANLTHTALHQMRGPRTMAGTGVSGGATGAGGFTGSGRLSGAAASGGGDGGAGESFDGGDGAAWGGSGTEAAGAGASLGASTRGTGVQPSWALPWQTGDRTLGRAMADAMRSKRTPIGAFANQDLAKPNK